MNRNRLVLTRFVRLTAALPVLVCAFLGLAFALEAQAQTASGKAAATARADSAVAGGDKARQLSVATTSRKGDFDVMLENRVIRFYVPYSRSL